MENISEIREVTMQYIGDLKRLQMDFASDAIEVVADRGKQFLRDITALSAKYVKDVAEILGEEQPEAQ